MDPKRLLQAGWDPRLRLYKDDQVNRVCNEFDWGTLGLYVYRRRPVCRSSRLPGGHQRVPSARHATGCRASGHNGAISALAVSSDSRYLFSGGKDQTLRIWNLADLPPVDFNRVDEEAVERVRKMIAMSVKKEITSQRGIDGHAENEHAHAQGA